MYKEIVAFAIAERLPTIAGSSVFVREGLLMSYGPDVGSLRAMAIAAGVVGDPENPAALAGLDMTAERRGPAGRDRAHDAALDAAEVVIRDALGHGPLAERHAIEEPQRARRPGDPASDQMDLEGSDLLQPRRSGEQPKCRLNFATAET